MIINRKIYKLLFYYYIIKMTLKKILTGKPGNLTELIYRTIEEGLVIEIIYFGRLYEKLGFIATDARIIYQAGKYKVEEEWDAGKYGQMIKGREKETLEESLRKQAENRLRVIRESGLNPEEKVNINL